MSYEFRCTRKKKQKQKQRNKETNKKQKQTKTKQNKTKQNKTKTNKQTNKIITYTKQNAPIYSNLVHIHSPTKGMQ